MSARLKAADLAYDNLKTSMPGKLADAIGSVREAIASGWDGKHVPFSAAVKKILDTPMVIMAEASKPKITAPALNDLRNAIVHFYDHEVPGWDGEVTVDFFRDTTAHVFFFAKSERALLKEAKSRYMRIMEEGTTRDNDDQEDD